MPKLMWLFFTPFFSSIVSFVFSFIPRKNMKRLAVGMSFLPLLMLIFFNFSGWIEDQVKYAWLPSLSIEFYLKVDSLSLLFLYLVALITPISLLSTRKEEIHSPHIFYGLVLLLQGLLIGFFTARDLMLFVIFWEAMLFPLYFLITLWGKSGRQITAIKFLIYMVVGSSLMVAASLALYLASNAQGSGTFNLDVLTDIAHQAPYAVWICAVFVLAFSVKTPLFPFHAWLPDTYYQASTTGTILLSSLLSKAGIYGFLRIGLGLFPNILREWSPLLIGLAIIGVLYGGLAAWRQNDYKRLIAYSSFSHVNFILVGVLVWNEVAHEGAILQAFNHGITIAGLFLVAGWLEERLGSTVIGSFSGSAKFFPYLCWLTMIFVLSSVALPGTNNFIGELLILFGLFEQYPWLTFILGLSVILSVIYMLNWMQEVYFKTPKTNFKDSVGDIKIKQLFTALPLVALIFLIGIYPRPVLEQALSAEKDIIEVEEQ